ncbi:MAG: class I SAM-dependent methyltransferase [candidate division Zixibacteria bacterium]|nr:class I SAM-dependent methyltransferase [candidate division Zixibacteria bacterium]
MIPEEKQQYEFDFEAVFDPDDYFYFYEDIITDEVTERQVLFLIRELELDQPRKILDLACGHGRHANRLAGLGHEVTGVDLTAGFLEAARREAEGKKLKVRYLQKDMREISFDEEFDRVLLMFTALGYFSDEENFKVLENIHRALKPGGLLCFDTINRDLMLKNLRAHHITDKEGNLMLDRNSFDPVSGYIHNHRTIIRDGKRKDFKFSIRLYNATEISLILERAGFQTVKMYGTWDSGPLTDESWRMIVMAQKSK